MQWDKRDQKFTFVSQYKADVDYFTYIDTCSCVYLYDTINVNIQYTNTRDFLIWRYDVKLKKSKITATIWTLIHL